MMSKKASDGQNEHVTEIGKSFPGVIAITLNCSE